MQRKIVGLILAAGYSRRMGDFKPLLTIDGKPIIAWAVDSFRRAGIADIRVVIGYQAEMLLPVLHSLGVTPVINHNYSAGMFSSVQAGLQTFSTVADAFFLLPGDMPMVKRSTLEKILTEYERHQYQVVIPSCQSRRGHPPLVSRSCFPRILTGDASDNLRSILQEFAEQTGVIETTDRGILLDLDNQQDYQSLREYFTGQ